MGARFALHLHLHRIACMALQLRVALFSEQRPALITTTPYLLATSCLLPRKPTLQLIKETHLPRA